jgi:hypothetical protein
MVSWITGCCDYFGKINVNSVARPGGARKSFAALRNDEMQDRFRICPGASLRRAKRLNSTSSLEAHADAVPGAQGHGGLELDAMSGIEGQMEAPGNGGKEQNCFHHGESRADADARASPEGEIGETGDATAADGIIAPAFGIEAFGPREKAGVALGDPLKEKNVGARREAVSFDLEGVDGLPANAPGRRIEAQGLLDDHLRVGETNEVDGGGRLMAGQRGAQFFEETVFGFGILCEQEGSGEHQSSAFMAGDEEGHDFIAHLAVGRGGRGARGFTGVEKARKKIGQRAGASGGAAPQEKAGEGADRFMALNVNLPAGKSSIVSAGRGRTGAWEP